MSRIFLLQADSTVERSFIRCSKLSNSRTSLRMSCTKVVLSGIDDVLVSVTSNTPLDYFAMLCKHAINKVLD